MALKQGQQILLVQAEFLRQQVAAARKDRHTLGPGLPQAEAVGARHVGGEIVAVMLDDTHLQAPCPQQGDDFFQ